MFVLQTTIFVLITFLALCAYETMTRFLKSKGARSRTSDSPSLEPIADTKQSTPPLDAKTNLEINTHLYIDSNLEKDKELYYKIHNVERYPEILPQCRERLLSLLAETLKSDVENPQGTILELESYSKEELEMFLRQQHDAAGKGYDEYIERRRNGGLREMFADADEAKWWLKQAAPVKYVDGAWLGHINKITTPFDLRRITKNAWQVMSEELGDGDLVKNHVYVYRELMQEIEAGLPEADAREFIDPEHNLSQVRCWKAAVAQLLISLFPHEFLPEILGFNMAYESLPLHLMKTVKELDELKINSYYFTLHISIDNADSGHAAMAMLGVTDYIDNIRQTQGASAVPEIWRRVQAGYNLAERLPTTPMTTTMKCADKEPRTKEAEDVLTIFRAKAPVAHRIHCNSRLKIGEHTLVEWLDPRNFDKTEKQDAFLHALANRKPWVVKGDSSRSRLIMELSWEGRMFGSFTDVEVEVLRKWIDSLNRQPETALMLDSNIYFNFINGGNSGKQRYGLLQDSTQDIPRGRPCKDLPHRLFSENSSHNDTHDVFVKYPVYDAEPEPAPKLSRFNLRRDSVIDDYQTMNFAGLIPLWFASSGLLESIPNVPARCANSIGSAIVKILRAQYGFENEGPGVAGIDELHRTNYGNAIGLVEIGLQLHENCYNNLEDVMATATPDARAFASWMLDMSMRPLKHIHTLLGLSRAFLDLHIQFCEMETLSEQYRVALRNIVARELRYLEECYAEIESDENLAHKFRAGYDLGASAIKHCIYL